MSNTRRPRTVGVPLDPPPVERHAPRGRDEVLAEIVEENRRALLSCTGQPDCPSSIHVPSCWVAR